MFPSSVTDSLVSFIVSNRLVDSGKVPANEICIFEMSGRVGGRVYSMRGFGPANDLVVDIGGYRTASQVQRVTLLTFVVIHSS